MKKISFRFLGLVLAITLAAVSPAMAATKKATGMPLKVNRIETAMKLLYNDAGEAAPIELGTELKPGAYRLEFSVETETNLKNVRLRAEIQRTSKNQLKIPWTLTCNGKETEPAKRARKITRTGEAVFKTEETYSLWVSDVVYPYGTDMSLISARSAEPLFGRGMAMSSNVKHGKKLDGKIGAGKWATIVVYFEIGRGYYYW